MTQSSMEKEARFKYTALWVILLISSTLTLMFGSFYLIIRTSPLYIKVEQAELFSHGLADRLQEAGFSLWTQSENPKFFYGLLLEAARGRKADPGSHVLGRLPVLVAVDFWNTIEEISVEQLSAIIKGELSTWEMLTGHRQPISLVCSVECKQFLQSTFSPVTPKAKWVTDRKTLIDLVTGAPGTIAVLPWNSVAPQLRVVGIKTKRGVVHPFWSKEAKQEYPLTAEVRLLPSATINIFQAVCKGIQNLRMNRLLQRYFSSEEWLVGKDLSVLAAVGDLLFDRKVAMTSKQKGDLSYPLLETAEIFRQADLAFGNLECPLSSRGKQINLFRGDPAMAGVLAEAGFDVLSLANNHIFDCGEVAFFDTIAHLREKGIVPIGVGENINEARAPKIVRVNGTRVAFLAYTQIGSGFTYTRVPQHWAATVELPGVAEARADHIRMDVKRAKAEADLVFVSFHWGNEYVHYPTEDQKAWGRTALAAGADLVIGHHPHVLQGIEFGEKGVIAYSLGNFVFDQITFNRRQSLILQAAFDHHGVHQLRLIPVLITAEQPRVATGKVKQDILALITKVSKDNCEE